MRQIKIIEHISLDGVIQAPGGPDEEPGYDLGGWSVPYFDPAVGDAIGAAQGERFDLLLGRRTYDIFAGYWPHQTGPMAESLNRARKHVATSRPESLAWGPAEHLGTDIAEGIREAKARSGPDMVVWGSSTLTPLLVAQGLADTVHLLVFPVLLGRGKRFFSDRAEARELALIDIKTAPTGVILSTYRPIGPLRTGSFAKPPA